MQALCKSLCDPQLETLTEDLADFAIKIKLSV
jgi:hypothetical protein